MSGILGGTFDPPHNGHIALAEAAIKELGLEKVIFIPDNVPPHKNLKNISTKEHRLAMLRLAVAGRQEFEISMIEFEREGPSYTVDTVARLKSLHPDANFCFLLGADNVVEMEDWYHPERIFKMITVCAGNRPGFVPRGRFAEKVQYFDMNPVDISSTAIRDKVGRGESISGLVPSEVEKYIHRNNLYKKNE